MEYILLIVGMFLLIKGADFFVDGSASVARRFHVPSVIIGLTIVALGTSLPEASVSINASIIGSNEIAISNIVGSNIFNTLVVVGCSALIAPFVMDSIIVKRDLYINILASLALAVFVLNGVLGRAEGLIFLAGLIVFLFMLIRSALNGRVHDEDVQVLPLPKCAIFIIGGVAAIIIGGNVVVDSATVIAANFGMSDTLIGLTIVSIGTSLPELVTSVVAAKKNESGLSLGNAIGSNILNILFILGTSSTLHPILATVQNRIDAWILVAVAVFMLALSKISDQMSRKRGVLMIAIYVIYMIYIIVR